MNENCPASTPSVSLFSCLNTWQLHLPVCATSTLPSRPHYAKRRHRPEPFSLPQPPVCPSPSNLVRRQNCCCFHAIPAVAAVAVPSSAPAQPPRGLGAERAHLGDGAAGAMSRPGSVLPSENGASRPPRVGRRAEPRLRSVLPHTGSGNSRTPRTPKEQGRLINGACGPAAARPEPPGAAPAGPLAMRGRQSRGQPRGPGSLENPWKALG